MNPIMELPAVVEKSRLPEIAASRGSLSDEAITIDGTEHAPGTLVLLGFAGALDLSDKLYHGCLRFRLATPDETGATAGAAPTVVTDPAVIETPPSDVQMMDERED